MNAEPHTHEIKVERYYEALQSGGYVVRYGDTRKTVFRGPFLERRILRAGRRAIAKHDRGSLKAGRAARLSAKLNERVNAELGGDGKVWASQR